MTRMRTVLGRSSAATAAILITWLLIVRRATTTSLRQSFRFTARTTRAVTAQQCINDSLNFSWAKQYNDDQKQCTPLAATAVYKTAGQRPIPRGPKTWVVFCQWALPTSYRYGTLSFQGRAVLHRPTGFPSCPYFDAFLWRILHNPQRTKVCRKLQ